MACRCASVWLLALLVSAGASRAEVPERLRAGLQASSPKVRMTAAAAVAATADPAALRLLQPLLTDEEAAVRAAVIDALGALGDPAAIAAIEAASRTDEALVQAVAARVVLLLKNKQTPIFVGLGEDLSGTRAALGARLRERTRTALAKRLGVRFAVHEDPSRKGLGAASLGVRSVTERQDGADTLIDVKCELTVAEMPDKLLRAALATTATVGVEGALTTALREELITDGVDACAPALAEEFADYVRRKAAAGAAP